MPFPDLPPERIPGSPGHLNDHQLIDQALDYIQQSGYRDDPNFPPLPDVPVLGQSGHVTAHDRILAVLQYVKENPGGGMKWATVSNSPTGTYKGSDGHTYAYYLFESDGTLPVTTAGLLDVLLVSCGGGTRKSYGAPGNGGDVRQGLTPFDARAHAVTIGKPGGNNNEIGQATSVGDVRTTLAGPAQPYGAVGAGGQPNQKDGLTSSITGEPYSYAQAGRHTNYGDGAPPSTDNHGIPGVAIVKTRLN